MSDMALPKTGAFPRFSTEEYARRQRDLRADMDADGLDALLIWGASIGNGEPNGAMNMASAYYLSNYADLLFEYVLFPLQGEPTLFAGPWSEPSAIRQWSVIEDVRVLPPTGIKPVVERLRELGLEGGKIGIVGGVRGQMNLPLEHLEALTAAFPSMELPRSHNIVDQRRAIKSEEEIAWLREGCRMTDSCFAAVRDHARPGLLDYELRAIILEAILDEGGMTHIELCAATPMRAPRLPFPLMHKSERALAKGDIILTEISAGFYGYAGQQQRPFAVGEPPTAEYRAVFDFAAHLFDEVCATLRPGCTTGEIWPIYDKMLANGYTNFGPLLHGWGMGMDVPIVGTHGAKRQLDFVFEKNMTVIVQPNPVVDGTDRGVFLGNMVVVTEDGARSMSDFPFEFTQI